MEKPCLPGNRGRRFPALARTIGGLIIATLLLAACSGAGGGSSTPPTLKEVTIQQMPAAAYSNLINNVFAGWIVNTPMYGAYWLIFVGDFEVTFKDAIIQAMLSGWTENQPTTYSDGTNTFTWSHSGNTWTWTFLHGTNSFSITLTAIASGWNVAVIENGLTSLTGSVTEDGTYGSAALVDPQGGTGTVTVAWEPDTGLYAYKFTITGTGDFAKLANASSNATVATVILETDTAGVSYSCSYLDNATPTPYSWSPT